MKQSAENSIYGFTLIEMLVVFTLLALLLTLAVPRYLNTADASRAKVREQNIATIRDALDKFKADQGRYPRALHELVEKRYLRALPHDPVTNSTDWTVLEDSANHEAGVFDVAPPAGATAGGDMQNPAVTQQDGESMQGSMPVPTGAVRSVPVPGAAVPTPINKAVNP